jgi:hypothetical protein
MNKIRKNIFVSVWELYRDGFRNMTWGKQLWFLILLKVIILFAVLRVFFFKPAMAGMTVKQKSEHVGYNLTHKDLAVKNDTITIVSKN